MDLITLTPLINGFFVLFLGFFILARGEKDKLNLLFFFFTILIAWWQLCTFKMFLSKTGAGILFWDRLNYITAILAPIVLYHFALELTGIRTKLRRRLLILGYILASIFLVLSRTNYLVSGVFWYQWGAHATANVAHHPLMAYLAFYLSSVLYVIYDGYKKVKDPTKHLQLKYIFWSITVFLFLTVFAFFPAYKIAIYPFSYFSGIVLVAAIFYIINKYFLFGIRVFLTEILVGIMEAVLLILPFLVKTPPVRFLTITIFILFSIFGYLLIKITHREIRAREKVERAYKKLKRLDEAKTEFISIASHQLRTPLTAIKGYISMILEGNYGEIPEKVKKPMKNVFESNERLINLVNDLLNVSRIESGKLKLDLEQASLEELISEVVEELKMQAQDKGVEIKWEPPQDLPDIRIDYDKIRQVILNIIDNAISYTEQGEIMVKAEQKDSKIKITISDTGEGMTQKEIEHLFDRFTRGKAGNQLNTEGVGLGLYVGKKFVDMHGGEIWAESEGRGQGSTFHLTLPLNPKHEQNTNSRR